MRISNIILFIVLTTAISCKPRPAETKPTSIDSVGLDADKVVTSFNHLTVTTLLSHHSKFFPEEVKSLQGKMAEAGKQSGLNNQDQKSIKRLQSKVERFEILKEHMTKCGLYPTPHEDKEGHKNTGEHEEVHLSSDADPLDERILLGATLTNPAFIPEKQPPKDDNYKALRSLNPLIERKNISDFYLSALRSAIVNQYMGIWQYKWEMRDSNSTANLPHCNFVDDIYAGNSPYHHNIENRTIKDKEIRKAVERACQIFRQSVSMEEAPKGRELFKAQMASQLAQLEKFNNKIIKLREKKSQSVEGLVKLEEQFGSYQKCWVTLSVYPGGPSLLNLPELADDLNLNYPKELDELEKPELQVVSSKIDSSLMQAMRDMRSYLGYLFEEHQAHSETFEKGKRETPYSHFHQVFSRKTKSNLARLVKENPYAISMSAMEESKYSRYVCDMIKYSKRQDNEYETRVLNAKIALLPVIVLGAIPGSILATAAIWATGLELGIIGHEYYKITKERKHIQGQTLSILRDPYVHQHMHKVKEILSEKKVEALLASVGFLGPMLHHFGHWLQHLHHNVHPEAAKAAAETLEAALKTVDKSALKKPAVMDRIMGELSKIVEGVHGVERVSHVGHYLHNFKYFRLALEAGELVAREARVLETVPEIIKIAHGINRARQIPDYLNKAFDEEIIESFKKIILAPTCSFDESLK